VPRNPERRSGRSDTELRRWRREIEHAWLAQQFVVGSVLLINCIPDEEEMYAEHLRYSGIDPIIVCETPEAFQTAVAVQPAVIVTDIGIGDGVELIRQLRDDARTRTSVIIVVSARVFLTVLRLKKPAATYSSQSPVCRKRSSQKSGGH
jgi:CheY-like chemotaxis protein